jgi:plastocyanin
MLRRKAHFLPVVVAAAALASGCLQSYTGSMGPEPGPSDPGMTSSNGDRPVDTGGSTSSAPVAAAGGEDAGTPAAPPPDLAGPPAQTGTLAVMLNMSTDSIRLNDTKTYDVMVIPNDGFNGNVVYSVDGLPTGATATFDPAAGIISAATTVKLTIKTAGDATVGANNALNVKAVSGTISGAAPLTLSVLAELLVSIPKGVDIGTSAAPNLTAFGAQSIPTIFVAPGTKVTFVNDDTINHEIHSDGTLGIAHEGGPLQANAANTYTQTFNGKGTFNFRCHIHPNMRGQIVVK